MIPVNMIQRLHTAIVAAGVAIDGVDSEGRVSPKALQDAAQPTVDAFDKSDAAHAVWLRNQDRATAKALLTADAPNDKRFKALLLVTLDEINLIRSKLVPALQPRTAAQLKTAIAAKIDAGQADG